jgi:hypothetical protein
MEQFVFGAALISSLWLALAVARGALGAVLGLMWRVSQAENLSHPATEPTGTFEIRSEHFGRWKDHEARSNAGLVVHH